MVGKHDLSMAVAIHFSGASGLVQATGCTDGISRSNSAMRLRCSLVTLKVSAIFIFGIEWVFAPVLLVLARGYFPYYGDD